MKTCQSTGYFKQAQLLLLLCFVSSLVSAGPALALSGNNINACFDCHGSTNDIRPLDTTTSSLSSYRNITTGAIKGSHRSHVTNLPTTMDGNTCNPCHGSAITDIDHRNGTIAIDANIGYRLGLSFVNQTSIPILGSCATASCHSATTSSVTSPVWGATAPSKCGYCHSSSPSTGNHTKHLSGLAVSYSANASCNDCHTGAVIDSAGGAGHGNGLIDVTTGNYPTGRAKSSTYSTCTTSSCHSNGSGSYKPVTWGATNGTGCNFCHDAFPTSGSHSIHIANYAFGCAECHGHNGTGTAHNDGSLNIVTVGYNGSKQCATSDCHSAGKTGTDYTLSPAWGGSFTGDRCAGCHGNWPTGDAHAAHQVGIHYDDVANATIGKIPATAASTLNAGHGNATYSTTVSCNMCHNLTVTVTYNDLASTCNTCHPSGTGGNKGSLTTASVSKTYHVNRSKEVNFAAATIKSKAQIRAIDSTVPELNNFWTRTNGYKAGLSSHDASKTTLAATASYNAGTCSAVVCHNGNSISWTSGAISCDKCHTALP